ncbi:hypothetical protein SAMN05444146_3130 [Flavobacterium johnsoniae]|nr:hypothetical protein SAMN05444146_3130 [Flavobacterium johnsoniae]
MLCYTNEQIKTATNSRYTRFGYLAEFKNWFVFGKFVFNRKITHL